MDKPSNIDKLPHINKSPENRHYRDISLLGKGSYGSVYLVQETVSRKYYANKKIKYMTRSGYDKQSIINELRMLSCHNCPYIIQLHNAYIKDGYLNLITEYAKKGDLSNVIKRCKVKNSLLGEETIKRYLFELCIAVEYLHKNNVIHRDIKAANVFLSKNNTIKLGDVGIIKVLIPSYKYANTNIGTPYYMSPEVYKRQRYNTKTDIWSIGVLLYELMTLKLPYSANDIAGLKYKISNNKWTLSNKYRNLYSDDLCDLLEHILDVNQTSRFTIDQVLNHGYLKSEYKLYNVQYDYKPLHVAFYSKSIIPYTIIDWKQIIKQYAVNEGIVDLSPKRKIIKYGEECPPNKIYIDDYYKLYLKNPPLNGCNKEIPKLPVQEVVKKPVHNLPPLNKDNEYKVNQHNKLDKVGINNALDIITKMDLLVKYISSARYNSYYILRQEVKKLLKGLKESNDIKQPY